MNKCIYCESANIKILVAHEKINYKSQKTPCVIDYSLCSDCGREYLLRDQILRNDARLREAKKVVDGLLTSQEIKTARLKLRLTQEQASLVFGGGKNAFSKYESSEVSQSKSMDKLIRTCLHHPNAFKDLLSDAGISND
ncbi:MAG: type II toxin-antitoxin system MqsA family antitoxin [Proteobacteria bacterium]|nr:type II toxin-antitoxin system MqsA family antitoxin [Pseudomonadota bacterium]